MAPEFSYKRRLCIALYCKWRVDHPNGCLRIYKGVGGAHS